MMINRTVGLKQQFGGKSSASWKFASPLQNIKEFMEFKWDSQGRFVSQYFDGVDL